MARNELIADQRVVDAAHSLVKLCIEHEGKYKAIVFDIDAYMEVVIGKGIIRSANIEDVTMEHIEAWRKHEELRNKFKEALGDAFTLTEVCEGGSYLMTEIGGAAINGIEGTYYQITKQPADDEMFVLPL